MIVSVDFHNHSFCSYDASVRLEDFLSNREVDIFAVTDHNNIDFHKRYSNGKVIYKIEAKWFIVGEEIMTADAGEIIGLFLKEEIKPYMTLEETIRMIKEQDGIVYLPHPFDFYRKGRPKLNVVKKYMDLIDVIEVFNAKYFTNIEFKLSRALAEKYGKIKGYGSDAHSANDLAKGYITLKCPDEISKESLMECLQKEENIVSVTMRRRNLLRAILKKFLRR